MVSKGLFLFLGCESASMGVFLPHPLFDTTHSLWISDKGMQIFHYVRVYISYGLNQFEINVMCHAIYGGSWIM